MSEVKEMGEELRNLYNANVTIISNDFFFLFLADVNPEFLKVYLYFLWRGKENLSFEDVANELNLTVNDVERAVKYWAKQKKLNSTKSKKEIINIDTDDNIVLSKKQINNNEDIDKEHIYTIEADFLKKKKKKIDTNEKDYKELLLYAEQMLPNISNLQVNLFHQLYYDDGMSLEVIEYLIEYCAELGKVNTKYMTSVANTWIEEGYKTVEEVKNSEQQFRKEKSKKTKSIKRKTNVVANKRENDYYENLFLQNSQKKGNV